MQSFSKSLKKEYLCHLIFHVTILGKPVLINSAIHTIYQCGILEDGYQQQKEDISSFHD